MEQRAPLVVRPWDAAAAVPSSAGAAATLVRESDGLHGVVQVAPPERPSRYDPKCGQRGGAQTADVDGECFTAGAPVAGGRRLLIGCSDGDASGASLLRACSAGANVHCVDSSGAPLLRACGVELSARAVVAAGASRELV